MDVRVRSTPPSGYAVTPSPASRPAGAAGEPAGTSWTDENRRGLAFAAAGAWPDASDAFSGALDALTLNEARDPAGHEAQALLLANMAQAAFRAGLVDDAIRHAQRGCALRVALCGEDAVAVARSRSDLAVILAASGRLDEAPALIARAIAGIEASVGEEDLRLAVVLENAGRVALACGQPASAEPFLLRLHALLGAHELSTDRADTLLARVFEARIDADVRSKIESASPAVPAVGPEPIAASRAIAIGESLETFANADAVEAAASFAEAHAEAVVVAVVQDVAVVATEPMNTGDSGADDAEWEDQPLRDAVVLTDALLRTTPTGNPVVRSELASHDPWSATAIDARAGDSALQAEAEDTVDDDIFGAHALELTDAPVQPTDAVAAVEPAAADVRVESSAAVGGLGFEVHYGVPLESGAHPALSASSSPAAQHPARERTAAGASESSALGLGPELELVPESSPRPDDPAVPPSQPRATPRSSAVVLPAPAAPGSADVEPRDRRASNAASAGSTAAQGAAAQGAAAQGAASRLTVHTLDALPENPRPAPRPPRVAAPAKKSRAGLISGGIAAVAAAAAAGWYFLYSGL